MAIFSRGFFGRRSAADVKLPPGSTLLLTFPFCPQDRRRTWRSTSGNSRSTTALPFYGDGTGNRFVSCLPRTSGLTCIALFDGRNSAHSGKGVSLDVLLAGVKTDSAYAMMRSYGDYTTNFPLKDLMNKQAWVAFKFDGSDLAPEHGGPARLLAPHLYLWKSAKCVRGMTLMPRDRPGFWESLGYHMYGDPWQEQRYSGE